MIKFTYEATLNEDTFKETYEEYLDDCRCDRVKPDDFYTWLEWHIDNFACEDIEYYAIDTFRNIEIKKEEE